jgi:uncharacterized protein YbaR (Trm112 family)
MIDRELLEILACPVCKTPLTHHEDTDTLRCSQCRRVYPIRDNIPILLVDEATVDES